MEDLLKELKEYFADLLIIQYRGAERNRKLIKFLVDLIFANNLAMQIKEKTVDVENSEGVQLETTGKWVGVDNFYSGELWAKKYLSFPLYSTIKNNSYSEYQGGFSTYTNFADNDGAWLMYQDWQKTRTQVNKMGDDYYKKIIQLKVIKNSIRHTCKNIDEAIWKWSGGNVYTTWGTMQITYHYKSSYKTIMNLALDKNVLLKPTGCELISEEIQDD